MDITNLPTFRRQVDKSDVGHVDVPKDVMLELLSLAFLRHVTKTEIVDIVFDPNDDVFRIHVAGSGWPRDDHGKLDAEFSLETIIQRLDPDFLNTKFDVCTYRTLLDRKPNP